MPDLTFLDKLPVSLQVLLGIPLAIAAYLVFAKGLRDKLFMAAPLDAREELRQRWEGPVTKHLDLLEQIADGLGGRREIYASIASLRKHVDECVKELKSDIRAVERSIDRMPPRR